MALSIAAGYILMVALLCWIDGRPVGPVVYEKECPATGACVWKIYQVHAITGRRELLRVVSQARSKP